MMHGLEMPLLFAGRGIDRQQRVCIQRLTHTIAAVEIRRRGAGWHIHEATRDIDAHAGPRIRATNGLPRIYGPRVVAFLAGLRNSVKGPFHFACVHIIRANVSRRGAFAFTNACALNQQVLVDDARTGGEDKDIANVAAKSETEVHPTGVAECRNRLSGGRIKGVQATRGGKQDPLLCAVGPVHHAAIGVHFARAAAEGVELPQQRAAVGAQCHNRERRRGRVHHTCDDDRRGLNL